MAININGLIGGHATTGASDSNQVNNSAHGPNKARNETANSAGKDTISLTEVSRQLPQLERKLNALPVVDVERVEAARQAIGNGSYTIHPESIARKFSQLESLLPA